MRVWARRRADRARSSYDQIARYGISGAVCLAGEGQLRGSPSLPDAMMCGVRNLLFSMRFRCAHFSSRPSKPMERRAPIMPFAKPEPARWRAPTPALPVERGQGRVAPVRLGEASLDAAEPYRRWGVAVSAAFSRLQPCRPAVDLSEHRTVPAQSQLGQFCEQQSSRFRRPKAIKTVGQLLERKPGQFP